MSNPFKKQHEESLENIMKLDMLQQCQLLLRAIDFFQPTSFDLSQFETPADLHGYIWSMDAVAADGGILEFLTKEGYITDQALPETPGEKSSQLSTRGLFDELGSLTAPHHMDLPWFFRDKLGVTYPIHDIIYDADAIYLETE